MRLSRVEEETDLQAAECEGARGTIRYFWPCDLSKYVGSSIAPAQVEDYLKDANKNGEDATAGHDPDMQLDDFDIGTGLPSHSSESHTQATSNHPGPPMETEMPSFEGPDDDFIFTGGELMGLGMSEALPPFEVMEELYDHRPIA